MRVPLSHVQARELDNRFPYASAEKFNRDIKKLGLTARATAAITLHAALMRSRTMPPDDPAHSARGASHGAAVPRSKLSLAAADRQPVIAGPVPDPDHGDRQRARVRADGAGGLNYCSNAIKYVPDLTNIVAFKEYAEADALDAETVSAAENLDHVIQNLNRKFAEGT